MVDVGEALSKNQLLVGITVLIGVGGVMVGAVTWLDSHVEHIMNKRAVPFGAVVAFDIPDCPSGWSRFDPAIGRAVVGVGIGKVIGSTDVFSPIPTYPNGYADYSPHIQKRNDKDKKKEHITDTTTYAVPMAYEYRFGAIISGVPEYVSLYYCKKVNE
jgi:hypothetical protein